MNQEALVNQWLSDMSGGQWQLEDGECHLSHSDGEHYCSIQLNSSRLLIMFPIEPAALPQDAELHKNLLLLNNYPEIIGFASFSLAEDNLTVVLSTALPCEAISIQSVAEFWQRSGQARNGLFSAVIETERR
ncbi:hypothetical protein F8538_05880 [Edwardsiella ictaluri]|uniref:hypothetical protein n=1 Tax=Edwardsiella ictaluri TaxID=67780 RepID=UPI0009BD9032|nr:hypothetical protein [Edwardsiella ictaluri]ARD38056.1 hypothetical protein B6E78_00215 [Edwardsiella ictaluri]QPW26414.1 hypothetical protein F8538_05880 [Edwardsiella ictaluri]